MAAERTAYELAMAEPGIEEWRNTRETTNERSLKTLTVFIGIARRVAKEAGLNESFVEMTPAEAGKLNQAMKDEGLSSGIFVAVRGFLNFHERTKQAKNIKPRQKRTRMRPDVLVTVEEQNKLLAACGNLRDRALLATLWDTGMRIHEACALKLRDVKVETHNNGAEHKLVKLWIGKTKTQGEERNNLLGLQVSEIVLSWVSAYPADIKGGQERPLFPSHSSNHYGGHTHAFSWSDRVKDIGKKAGLGDERAEALHPHLSRHTRATNLLRQGVPEATVKKLLGWTEKSTVLGQYTHMADADADDAVLKMNGFEAKRVVVESLIVPTTKVPSMPQQWTPGNVSIDALVEKKVRALLGMRQEESLDGGPGD